MAGAQVMVEGGDKGTVTSDRGEYWRLLLPGHYKSVWTNITQIIHYLHISEREGRGSRKHKYLTEL